MRPATQILSSEEMKLLQEAQQIQQLRESLPFQKVYYALKMTVLQAQNDLEANTNPHADAYYKLIWQSRKHMLDAIDAFIDATIAKRREAIQEFLRSFNVDEDLIERNLDNPLSFLMPNLNAGGPTHGNDT